MSIWEYANPKKFTATVTPIIPWAFRIGLGLLAIGLIWGYFFTPSESRQGASVKIIYLHVPAAFFAVNIWIMMLVTSLIWVIRRHHVSALAAKAAAPVGMVMTLLALITGALWGTTTWGTWWVWDPRLTSFLILFLFYLGYLALWEAISDPDTAADLTAILCIVGSVFAFLSRYAAVYWAQGLHQDASLSLDAEENVSDVFWQPLVLCMLAFGVLFIALVLLRTRTEIMKRRAGALLARKRRSEVRV
jgi:heme exporter protein C